MAAFFVMLKIPRGPRSTMTEKWVVEAKSEKEAGAIALGESDHEGATVEKVEHVIHAKRISIG